MFLQLLIQRGASEPTAHSGCAKAGSAFLQAHVQFCSNDLYGEGATFLEHGLAHIFAGADIIVGSGAISRDVQVEQLPTRNSGEY